MAGSRAPERYGPRLMEFLPALARLLTCARCRSNMNQMERVGRTAGPAFAEGNRT
jgi:hypothetical protein